MDIVLIYGNFWFPCVNFPESAVCHVICIKNEHSLFIRKVLGASFSEIWISRKSVKCDKYCQNRGIERLICIPQNNVNAHNLLPALFKLFNEQTVDKYILSGHWEGVYHCTFENKSIVNVVSILSTLKQVYSHGYVYSLQRKWNYYF